MSDITVTIDPALRRNARLALQGRVEGVVTLQDDPVVISETATTLTVELPDTLPAEELQGVIRTIANLVNRPGSGILSALTIANPVDQEGLQRVYSV